MVSKKVYPSNGGRGAMPPHRRSMQFKKPPVMKIPPPMLAAHMMMMEGDAYNQLMFNTSQIPDNHSYVDFNLPTPPVHDESHADSHRRDSAYFGQTLAGMTGTLNGGLQKSKQKSKSSQGQLLDTPMHSSKEQSNAQCQQESVPDLAGQRRAKGASRSAMPAIPLHINGAMQRYNGVGGLAAPFPRPTSLNRRGRGPGGPMVMMMGGSDGIMPSPSLPSSPAHRRFVHPHHTQQLLPHRSRHHHPPAGCYPGAGRMMMRSPHPAHPGQMMPLGVGRLGPPPRLGGPVMAFMGRGVVRMPPRLPLPPPPPPLAMGGHAPLPAAVAGSQIPPLPPPPPLVPFMNGMTTMQTQLMKKLTKGKSTIKTLKTLMSQYPIDKPWVTESIRSEYEKKVDLEERLKGNKDDDLFAQFKVQRDKFVGMYELARDEYLKQEADAIKAKVT